MGCPALSVRAKTRGASTHSSRPGSGSRSSERGEYALSSTDAGSLITATERASATIAVVSECMGYLAGSRSTTAQMLKLGTQNSVAFPGCRRSLSFIASDPPYAANLAGW